MPAFRLLLLLAFDTLRPWAAKLRTLLITAVLAIWCLKALPGKPFDQRPGSDRVVANIDDAFERVGIYVTRDAIKQVLTDATTPLVATRNALVHPVDPLFEFAQMGQSWGLFLQGGCESFRLQIEGQSADGAWTMLYRHHRLDLLGLHSWLGFRRLRGIHSPGSKGPRGQYDGFVSWVAHKIFDEHAEYRAVRVSMERLRLGTRKEPSRTLAIEHERVRERQGAS